MVGMLQRGEADVVISKLSISEERLQVVDFSYPFNRMSMTFATRNPEYSPNPESFLLPFTFEVWISIMTCLIFVPFMLYVLLNKQFSLQKLALATFSTLLGRSTEIPSPKSKDYILLSCLKLGFMFLGYSYTAVLLSFLTFPPLQGVRTIPELANAVAEGKYFCTVQPGSFILPALLSAPDQNSRIIAEDLLLNEQSKDVDGVLGNTKSAKKPAFLNGQDFLFPFKTKYFISKDEFFPALRAIAVRKDFCCKSHVDHVIRYVWASGLYEKLLADDGYIKSLKVLSDNAKTSNVRRLSLEDFEGAFILVIFGYFLATITFLCELITSKLRKRFYLE
jgi:ABC-type amino acid transport substrate-binding protein